MRYCLTLFCYCIWVSSILYKQLHDLNVVFVSCNMQSSSVTFLVCIINPSLNHLPCLFLHHLVTLNFRLSLAQHLMIKFVQDKVDKVIRCLKGISEYCNLEESVRLRIQLIHNKIKGLIQRQSALFHKFFKKRT